MKRPRVLKPEETRLWHKIARSTKPRSMQKMHELEAAVRIIEAQEEKETRPQKETLKKLHTSARGQGQKPISSQIQDAAAHKRVRRGKIEIAATIDLHGFNQDEAKSRLQTFIFNAFNNNFRCVLVITGKGSKANSEKETHFDFFSSPRGIIRSRFKDWLHEPQIRYLISGIATANPKHGGSGAFYVLLKANTKDKV